MKETDNVNKDKNYHVCRLLKSNLHYFYDNIYIPYKLFREGEWLIDDILEENRDSLFFNEKYFKPNDIDVFNKIFKKYLKCIKEIFSDETSFREYLVKKKSYLKNRSLQTDPLVLSDLEPILNHHKYNQISPVYIIDCYSFLIDNFDSIDTIDAIYTSDLKNNNHQEILKQLKKHLREMYVPIERNIQIFKHNFEKILDNFVLHSGNQDYDDQVFGLINEVIKRILKLTKILLDHNFYAVHSCISDIVDEYLPLDDINEYDISDYNNRQLIII